MLCLDILRYLWSHVFDIHVVCHWTKLTLVETQLSKIMNKMESNFYTLICMLSLSIFSGFVILSLDLFYYIAFQWYHYFVFPQSVRIRFCSVKCFCNPNGSENF